jgi:hypothetical protein
MAGAAAKLRREYSILPTPTEVRQLQSWLRRAQAELSQPDADAAWTLGEQSTREEAVADALTLELSPSAANRTFPSDLRGMLGRH